MSGDQRADSLHAVLRNQPSFRLPGTHRRPYGFFACTVLSVVRTGYPSPVSLHPSLLSFLWKGRHGIFPVQKQLGYCCWVLVDGFLLLGFCCWVFVDGFFVDRFRCWVFVAGFLLLGFCCWVLVAGFLLLGFCCFGFVSRFYLLGF